MRRLNVSTGGRVSALTVVAVIFITIAVSFTAAACGTEYTGGDKGIASPAEDVRYHDYDGSAFRSGQIGQAGEIIEILFDKIPERKGYVFIGWAETKGGEVKYTVLDDYQSRFVTMPNDGIDLYAVWKEVDYRIGDFAPTSTPNADMRASGTDHILIDYVVAAGNYTIKRMNNTENLTLQQETVSGNVIQLYGTFSNASDDTRGFKLEVRSTNPAEPLFLLLDGVTIINAYDPVSTTTHIHDNAININNNSTVVIQYIEKNSITLKHPDTAAIRVARAAGNIATMYMQGQGDSELSLICDQYSSENGAAIGGNGADIGSPQEKGGMMNFESGSLSVAMMATADMLEINALSDTQAPITPGASHKLMIEIDGDGTVEVKFNSAVVTVLTASGETYVPDGTAVTLTATSATGKFSFWNSNTAAGDSISNTLSFTMNADGFATAVFTKGVNNKELTIKTTGNGKIALTVNQNGSQKSPINVNEGRTWFSLGTETKLEAIPGTDSKFLYWVISDAPTVGISGNTLNHTVAGNVTITAVFADSISGISAYKVTIVKDYAISDGTVDWSYTNSGVTVTGGAGTFNMPAGTTLALKASSGAYFDFIYWGFSTDQTIGIAGITYNHTVVKDITISAVFINNTSGTMAYKVTVNKSLVTADGIVTWSYFYAGLTVTGGIGTFNVPKFAVFTPTAADGAKYDFLYWKLSTIPSVGMTERTLSNTVAGAITITACFADNTSGTAVCAVTVTKDPAGANGTVTWSYTYSGVTLTGGAGTFNIPKAVVLMLTAAGVANKDFFHWKLSIAPGTAIYGTTYNHTVASDVTITAVFANSAPVTETQKITVAKDPAASDGTVTWSYTYLGSTFTGGAGTFNIPKSAFLTLTAANSANYDFLYWKLSTAPGSTISGTTYNHSVVGDVTITAAFASSAPVIETHKVTVAKDPAASDGTVTWSYTYLGMTYTGGAGTFNIPKSAVLTLTAANSANYDFLYWKLSTAPAGTISGTTYNHTVAGDVTITAAFASSAPAVETHKVTVAKDPAASDGTVTWSYIYMGVTYTGGAGTFNIPKSAVLTLTAADGANYDFLYWKLNSATTGTSGTSFSHTITGTVNITAVFSNNASGTAAYAVTVAKDPAAAGGAVAWSYTHSGTTVTGGTGTFNMPKSAVLTLTAADGANYSFLYWKLNSATAGTSGTSYSHTVAGTVKITATFVNNSSGTAAYAVTVAKDPAAAGGAVAWSYTHSGTTVTGGTGTFNMPKSAVLTLTAADGANYSFLYWKLNSATAGTSGTSYSHTVAGNATITAVFANNSSGTAAYAVTVAKGPTAADGTVSWSYTYSGVTVTGGTGTFNIPKSAVLTLTAADGTNYDFLYWKLNNAIAGTPGTSYSHTVAGNVTITAFFTDNTKGTAAYAVTATKNTAATDGTISWSYTDLGVTVTGGMGTFNMPAGATLTLTAKNGSTYAFQYWNVSSPQSTNTNSTINHMIAGTATIAAHFSAVSLHKVIIDDSTAADGTVSWAYNDGIAHSGKGAATFYVQAGTVVSLTAADGSTCDFLYWKLSTAPTAGTSGTSYNHTVTGNVTITAFFVDNSKGTTAYKVTVSKDPAAADGNVTWSYTDSGVTVTGGMGIFNMPAKATLALTAADGASYDFLYWKFSSAAGGTSGTSCSHTVAGSVNITAVFVNNASGTAAYAVKVAKDPAAINNIVSWSYIHSGMTIAGGTGTFNVPKSAVLTLTASDGAGYNFLYWKFNSATAGTPGTSYSHTVAGNATITAVFVNNASGTAAYEVTVAKDPAATDGAVTWSYTHSGTTVTGGMGTFNMPKSAVLILTATEGANYDLLYWKLNSATAGTSGTSFSHTVVGAVRISAVFMGNTSGAAAYAVTVAKDPASVNGTVTWSYTDLGVTVTGGVGTFNIPRSAVLTLTAAGGASGDFLYWKLNNANVGTPGTSYTHMVAGTAKITAVFANNVSGTAAYAVTVAKDPVAADGTVTWSYTDSGMTVTGGAGTFSMPKSTLLTLTAADGANHDFLYWKLNSATTGTSGMSYVHTVAGTVKISAVFVNNTTGTAAYEVTVANDLAAAYRAMAAESSTKTGGTLFWSYTHSGMTVTGGAGTFNMPRSAVLTLTAADGANNDFLYWKLNSATAGMPETSYTYTITGTTKISAVFADNTSGTAAYEVTVAKDPTKIDGAISWSYTHSGMTVTGGTGTFSMPAGVTLDLIATDGTTAFLQWEVSSPHSTDESKTISHTVAGAAKITAKFTAPSQAYNNPKEYLLTATSDGVTAITPNGTVTVLGGGNRTFNFSASDGYYVSKVQIDGIDLSQEEISLGYYTFHDVNSSHIISVSGSTSPLIDNNAILRVVVVEGNGYAMYSINNSSYQIYSGPVSIPENAYVSVRAIADKKYEFSGWGNNGEIYWNDLDYSMQDLAESMYLELHFASMDDSGGLFWWTLAAIVALVIAGTIIGLIFFFGKSYDVIKASYSADIIGRDRARNKKDYRFSVEEGFLGTVLYRVGKDGKWKILLPTKNGDYVIPKDEVVDEFIIETR